MNGREENNLKIEGKIAKRIQGQPQIIQDYSFSFTKKTATTKLVYINYLLEFLEYLKDIKKENIADVNTYTKLKTSDINRYIDYIRYRNTKPGGNGESICAVKLFALSYFYEFLIAEGYTDKNPCKKVETPKHTQEKEVIAMTPKEIGKLKNNILKGCGSERAKIMQQRWKNRDLAIITLGCTTGLRVTSITEINLDDINFDEKVINVTEKGNKTRKCYIGDKTMEIIQNWLCDREELLDDKNTNALFISSRRTRITPRSIARLLEKYTVGFDKHITPHKMRSSCATNLYNKTGDIYLVQAILGHKNIENTKRYAKVSDDRQKEAANILNKYI